MVQDEIQTICISNHWVYPKADNCVRENKNQTLIKTLCWLLLQKGLELTGVLFHRVGHTHGSLGGCFALRGVECK